MVMSPAAKKKRKTSRSLFISTNREGFGQPCEISRAESAPGLTLEECQFGQDVGTATVVGHLYRQFWIVRIRLPAS